MTMPGGLRLAILAVAFALVAVACSSDGGDSDSTSEDPSGTESETPTEPDATASDDTGSDDSGSGDTGSEPTGTAEEPATPEDTATPEDEMVMQPQYGGTLTYLLEAETDTWDIPNANCATSCITVMRAVADPMTAVNMDGVAEPFLLEAIESNADFTEFTLTMRDGVTFHDGTPVDGAAIQRNLVETATGVVQAQLLVDLENGTDSIELVDDMTVKVTFSRPFSVFPYFISDRVGGYVMSPTFWDDPDRAGAFPISTGPFRMVEWTRDERTVLERNENYWRADPTGNQLPYLDEVVFRPNPDASARQATMEAGDADANMTSNEQQVAFWMTTWIEEGGQLVEPNPARATSYLLLNSGAPPFDNPDMRRAVALCTDRSEYLEFRAPDSQLANGPFAEGDIGYVEDTGFPEFDPAAGSALLDEIGRPEVINYGYQDTPANRLTGELFADQWSTNCGLDVQFESFDQSELITRALTGNFEVFNWRNHGQGNPGVEEPWWHSSHTSGLALNFGRIIDPTIDDLLDQAWATDDRADWDNIAQEISRVFGDQVYNLWLNSVDWINAYQGDVHGVGEITLESGNPAQGVIAGRAWVQEAWKEG